MKYEFKFCVYVIFYYLLIKYFYGFEIMFYLSYSLCNEYGINL